jgi:hypothetical protein
MRTQDIYESLEYELDDIANQLDEENVTANVAGYQSPNIFSKKPPRDSDIKKKKSNLKKSVGKEVGKSYKNTIPYRRSLSEINYYDYKNDDSKTNREKLNKSFIEIDKNLEDVKKIIDNNLKLKKDFQLDGQFWEKSSKKFHDINSKIVYIKNKIQELFN